MCGGVQSLGLTLINVKKALGLFEKLDLNTQLVFTCLKSGIETLEQLVKYAESVYC